MVERGDPGGADFPAGLALDLASEVELLPVMDAGLASIVEWTAVEQVGR